MKVSVTDNVALKPHHIKKLKRLGFDVSYYESIPYGKNAVVNRIGKGNIAVFDLITKIDKDVMDSNPNLKCLITTSTGYHNVDTDYAKNKGITVCNCPDTFSQSVTEFVFCMLTSLCRRATQAAQMAKAGIWAYQFFKGRELTGKTLGVIGAGKIGTRVIKLGHGLGMRVIINTAHPSTKRAKELKISKFVSLPELLKKSDFVSIHVPLNDKTRHMISEKELKLMKKGAILICLSPYEILDLKALYKALLEEKLGGAGLDSTRIHPEDFKKSPIYSLGLMNLPNVIITPDMAWYTKEGLERLANTVINNITAFAKGKPQNVVS